MPKHKGGVIRLKKKLRGTSWFFGIGINQYLHFPKLHNAVKDVQDVHHLLCEKYDVTPQNVFLLCDEKATEVNIIGQLDQLVSLIQPEDKLVIYYSGHGHMNHHTDLGYWIPHDAQVQKSATFIANSTIRDYIKVIPSKHTLLISDSCFSGSLFTRGIVRSDDAVEELGDIQSRWAICSGRHDEKVYDGLPGGNSPFAQSILDFLKRNERNSVNVGRLANSVVEQTRSNYEQLPEGSPLFGVGHKGGQYIFRLKGGLDVEKEDEKLPIGNTKDTGEAGEYTRSALEAKRPKFKRFLIGLGLAVSILVLGYFTWYAFTGYMEKVQTQTIQIVDPSNNTYSAVSINGSYWMTSDLNYDIPGEKDRHLFNNQIFVKDNRLGRLYPFPEVKEACANLGKGWRVPTNADWQALAQSFGTFEKMEGSANLWRGESETGKALFRAGGSGLELNLTGFMLNEEHTFSPSSMASQMTEGYYWTAEKGRFKIERFNHDIHLELLAQPIMWDHAYACRCIKDKL